MSIEVQGLSKRYRTVRAVDDVSFSVADGAVFAFLGSNGAGKSTTIGCLTSVVPYDSGRVVVAGRDVRTHGGRVRKAIGVVFQQSLLDPVLTVRENLRFRAHLSGLDRQTTAARIAELRDLIDLGDFLERPYGRLSGGQRRRVDIARALLHEPDILFLDEPTAGLDPASRATVWATMQHLRRERGLTVFLTTHYMEETEEADDVCIIDAGRIVATGTPHSLRARFSRSILSVTSADPASLAQLVQAEGAQLDGDCADGSPVAVVVADAAQARRLLAAHGDSVIDFEFRHGRMDDVFLALTGRTAADLEVAGSADAAPTTRKDVA